VSAQRLSARTLRRVSRSTGLSNLKHGVAHGGYEYLLTTTDHRHDDGQWEA
jgi:hypothetical protein